MGAAQEKAHGGFEDPYRPEKQENGHPCLPPRSAAIYWCLMRRSQGHMCRKLRRKGARAHSAAARDSEGGRRVQKCGEVSRQEIDRLVGEAKCGMCGMRSLPKRSQERIREKARDSRSD